MATLVLSTVGTALGGPVGAAIGALIGQSLDQQLLGGSKRGPRLGDLSVQTSSYGTNVPKIYGTMRVAGSVVWATDLAESVATSGAKGQPSTVYSYAVSIAVAVSSRPIVGIGRIWADGKLIRAEDGVFKVSTDFRFYDGNEDQELDPFVASVEGIANTPAYRGLALAVFENLELAEFGNRIPFLTFEIFGSEALPTVAEIAEDASGGAIRCSSDHQVTGFAAYGQSADSALSALIDAFGVDVLDEGDAFRSPSEAEPVNVPDRDLGSWMDDEAAPKVEREQASAKTVPSGLRLSFYDPLTDFQAGEVRAVVDDEIGKEEQIELAAVLNRANAECANQLTLARRWAKRDTLTLRLPPRFADLAPGSKIKLSDDGEIWTAQRCTLEGFVIVVELRRTVPILKLAAPDPPATMRKMSSVTSQEPAMALALFETPIAIGLDATRSTLVFAASSSEPGWRRPLIEVRCKSHSLLVHGAPHKSILGRTRSVLQAGKPGLIDEEAWVEIELVDRDQWLTSCDDQALKEACNLAQIGGEVIQFGDATPLGDGQFRLSRLLRGLRGTEGATVHSKGDLFLLIDPKSLVPITLPDWSVGSIITARVATPAGLATTCWTLSDHTMHYHPSPLSN